MLVGTLIRLAKCAGLQCDPSGLNIISEERQVRRLLWHQICCLDLHAAENEGPKAEIRNEDFNTSLPLKIDDAACGYDRPTSDVWTDTTFSLIKHECGAVHRFITKEKEAIEVKSTDLATVRCLVEKRKIEIEDRYLKHLDVRVPIQRCARLVGKLLTARFNVMLLHGHLKADNRNLDFQSEMTTRYDISGRISIFLFITPTVDYAVEALTMRAV